MFVYDNNTGRESENPYRTKDKVSKAHLHDETLFNFQCSQGQKKHFHGPFGNFNPFPNIFNPFYSNIMGPNLKYKHEQYYNPLFPPFTDRFPLWRPNAPHFPDYMGQGFDHNLQESQENEGEYMVFFDDNTTEPYNAYTEVIAYTHNYSSFFKSIAADLPFNYTSYTKSIYIVVASYPRYSSIKTNITFKSSICIGLNVDPCTGGTNQYRPFLLKISHDLVYFPKPNRCFHIQSLTQPSSAMNCHRIFELMDYEIDGASVIQNYTYYTGSRTTYASLLYIGYNPEISKLKIDNSMSSTELSGQFLSCLCSCEEAMDPYYKKIHSRLLTTISNPNYDVKWVFISHPWTSSWMNILVTKTSCPSYQQISDINPWCNPDVKTTHPSPFSMDLILTPTSNGPTVRQRTYPGSMNKYMPSSCKGGRLYSGLFLFPDSYPSNNAITSVFLGKGNHSIYINYGRIRPVNIPSNTGRFTHFVSRKFKVYVQQHLHYQSSENESCSILIRQHRLFKMESLILKIVCLLFINNLFWLASSILLLPFQFTSVSSMSVKLYLSILIPFTDLANVIMLSKVKLCKKYVRKKGELGNQDNEITTSQTPPSTEVMNLIHAQGMQLYTIKTGQR